MPASKREDLKKIFEERRKELHKNEGSYNRNVKNLGLRVKKDKDQYNIPYSEIAAYAGVGESSVQDFLSGRSVPHMLHIAAICRATKELKAKYEKSCCKKS